MNESRLAAARERLRPYVERSIGFSGWILPTAPTRLGPPQPWDYEARARELLTGARSVLDLGTGGGERFAEICTDYSGRAVATEEWDVNARVAADRLTPLGIDTVRATTQTLPFRDATFAVVLDRHEALTPLEVARVLAAGGTVLTQQVWRNWPELDAFFPRRTDFGDHFHAYQQGFSDAGLEIMDAREDDVPYAFSDLGEFVLQLSITSWVVPDFDPLGRDLEALLAFETAVMKPEGFDVSEGRYIIEASKPLR